MGHGYACSYFWVAPSFFPSICEEQHHPPSSSQHSSVLPPAAAVVTRQLLRATTATRHPYGGGKAPLTAVHSIANTTIDRNRETITQGMGSNGREQKRGVPRPPPLSLYIGREKSEVVAITVQTPTMRGHPAAGETNKKRLLSRQLSMKETSREVKWEKRRRQIQRQRSSMGIHVDHDHEGCFNKYHAADGDASSSKERALKRLTDEDLDELKGSMELGFGFDEENGGQNLCDTLPALDLYFAVNRQLSEPKMRASTSSLPSLSSATSSSSSTLCSTPSPGSPVAQPTLLDSLKICTTGDNPQLVKTRLRHWAQVVACSVKHSS